MGLHCSMSDDDDDAESVQSWRLWFLPTSKKKVKCNQIDAAESSRVESECEAAALQWIAPYF